MAFIDESCAGFVGALASKDAIPGGGGASALVGAIGTALGLMVGNLTVGKKKYADVEDEITECIGRASALQTELLRLVDEDAAVFEPLSKAYGIQKESPGRAQIMEDALKLACTAPMDTMRACAKAIDLLAEFANKGSVMAVSDAGAGAAFLRAAIIGASFNVFINTKSMTDRESAGRINTEANALLEEYVAKAGDIVAGVYGKVCG